MRKERLDGVGLAALVAVTFLLAVNQIMVKEVNRSLQPVSFAGARSVLAIAFAFVWLKYRGLWHWIKRTDLGPGMAIGALFAAEFLCLFMALDLTAVGRVLVIFYSMPLWLAAAGHFWLPNERITPKRGVGLGLAFVGTAWAILSKSPSGHGNLAGDMLALAGAWGWAGTAFWRAKPGCVRQSQRHNCSGWC